MIYLWPIFVLVSHLLKVFWLSRSKLQLKIILKIKQGISNHNVTKMTIRLPVANSVSFYCFILFFWIIELLIFIWKRERNSEILHLLVHTLECPQKLRLSQVKTKSQNSIRSTRRVIGTQVLEPLLAASPGACW